MGLGRYNSNFYSFQHNLGILYVNFRVLDRVFSSQVTTTIGFGSPNKANSYSVHGSALGAKEVEATRSNLGWPYEPFHVPEDVQK